MKLLKAICVTAMLLTSIAASGAERMLAHYTHQRWTDESDAPKPVFALAQDRRGYIWLAAATGLFRFDGMRFESISAGVDLVSDGPPSALLVRRNGEVWTNFERSGRFAVYRDGQLRYLRAPRAPHRVITMQEAKDGTVWVLTERMGLPLMRFRDGRWTSYGTDAGAPADNPFSMALADDGAVWVSFAGSVARLAPDTNRFAFVKHDASATGRLSVDPEGRIWLTERRGTYPITGPGGRGKPPPIRYAYRTDAAQIRGWPTFDREGNLWIATYYDGLQRVRHPDLRGAATAAESAARIERFTVRDGLTSNATAQIFQDAEGNIWVATDSGLDRFWPASFRFEAELSRPAAFGDLLLKASDGSVYIGEASTVYRVRPGNRPEPIFRTSTEPRTLCEAPDGSIWIGLKDKEIVVWREGHARRLQQNVPLSYTLYDCAFDASGDYWVTASLGGMARLHAGRWERMSGSAGEKFLPKSMIADAKGRLAIQWNDQALAVLDGTKRSTARIPVDNGKSDDLALYSASPDTLLVGGKFGLAQIRNGQVRSISARRAPLLGGVNGIAQAPDGETWLASAHGILRIPTAELERAFADPRRPLRLDVFGAVDGLRSRPHSHSRRSIVRGGDGRLWIATQGGTVWLDPNNISRSQMPPAVAVAALVADRVYRDPTSIRLPPGTSNIQIDFAVLSFSNPRATRARYRIEGQDTGWIEAGIRRQAFYTNLAPGTYRFKLIAANASGIWNERGATVEFVIPPTFIQSWWFAALCGALALLLLWLAYRLRMARIAATIRSRLEERLGERERIARELHDTLLQSVQGLILRFQSVANRMPVAAASRTQLEAALKRADEVIAEGRNRVQGLRTIDRPQDLPQLMKQRAMEAGLDSTASVRIVVEGKSRPVNPLVSAELVRIADEALFNIARHAKADLVEITIRFSARELGLEIRDDGVGMPVDVLDKGHKLGHFGLIGMRERAERIGGTFSVDSLEGIGCAVTVTVPARLGFTNNVPRRRKLFAWASRRKRQVND